jgi:hypothetical protein
MQNNGDTVSMMRLASVRPATEQGRSDSRWFSSCRLVAVNSQVKQGPKPEQRLKRLKLFIYHARAHTLWSSYMPKLSRLSRFPP